MAMENPLEMEVLIGKSPINSVFSIAMFDYRRVTKNRVSKLSKLISFIGYPCRQATAATSALYGGNVGMSTSCENAYGIL